jgi:hypothetical protein
MLIFVSISYKKPYSTFKVCIVKSLLYYFVQLIAFGIELVEVYIVKSLPYYFVQLIAFRIVGTVAVDG